MAHPPPPFRRRRRGDDGRRRGKWGGARPGAGAPRKGPRARVPHTRREEFRSWAPLHVTMRVRRHVWNLRAQRMMKVVRRAFSASNEQGLMRIVHYSAQGNHIHLIVEARDSEALSRALQGLSVRLARGLNKVMGRTGTVFADRYFARLLETDTQVRNALAYVLNNRRRHMAAVGQPIHSDDWVDPCSSGAWFDGWRGRRAEPPPTDGVVVAAELWILRAGWRRRGLIEVSFVPGQHRQPLGH